MTPTTPSTGPAHAESNFVTGPEEPSEADNKKDRAKMAQELGDELFRRDIGPFLHQYHVADDVRVPTEAAKL